MPRAVDPDRAGAGRVGRDAVGLAAMTTDSSPRAPLAAVMDVIGRPRARRSGQVSAMAWVTQSSSSARVGSRSVNWMPEPTIRCVAVRVARISPVELAP